MNYTKPTALPPEALEAIAELGAIDPVAAAILERVALALYNCGHVDGFADATLQIRADLDVALAGRWVPRG